MQSRVTVKQQFDRIEIPHNRSSARVRLGSDYNLYIANRNGKTIIENLKGNAIMFEEDYNRLKGLNLLKEKC